MNTLIIKDLVVTEELDNRAMNAVRGGSLPNFPAPDTLLLGASSPVNATQLITQYLNVSSLNGNNVAFANDIHTNIVPHQSASNTVNMF
ncbi:MAG: hypothetical protein WCA85_16345 [Paraburkholderia sp.]|uniref:hypothetical protein n=1 Tax=Paraburkholderia sp. TaxID=1926495 RepID=UPI003C4BFE66